MSKSGCSGMPNDHFFCAWRREAFLFIGKKDYQRRGAWRRIFAVVIEEISK